jgi:hypothetical protein
MLAGSNEAEAAALLKLFQGCDESLVTDEVVNWYSVETDETVRRKVLEYPPVTGSKYKPLLDLAKQDWDETNKSLAQKALDKLSLTPPKGGP